MQNVIFRIDARESGLAVSGEVGEATGEVVDKRSEVEKKSKRGEV